MVGPSPLPELMDSLGRSLRLGRKLGQGGEGSVFEVEGESESVAKIYHQPMPPERTEKLRAMVVLRTEQLDKLTAWPTDLLSLPSGVPIGLKMPKVVGHRDIHQLYSPKSRRTDFRHADWRFLVRTAANLSRAFAAVHDTSSVIADVNHGGILVGQDARVRLIDCDSFQVLAGAKRYLCDVGVPTFTPPELQGQSFVATVRTANHDDFGLAVMIFLLLFMGRHPFAGRYLGPGEMPIEQAIVEFRFAYGAARQAAQMDQPPGTPPLGIVSQEVARLFERAFAPQAASAGRPTAREWSAALETLESQLKQCAASPSHWHHASLPDCPWCQMEAATGAPLFSAAVSPGAAGHFDLDTFWKQVTALESPGPPPALELADAKTKLRPSADVAEFRRRRWFHGPLAVTIGGAALAIGIFVDLPLLGRLFFFAAAIALYVLIRKTLKLSRDITAFTEHEQKLSALWEAASWEWESKAGVAAYDAKRAELDRLREAYLLDREAAQPEEERSKLEAGLRQVFADLQLIHKQTLFARTSLKSKVEETHRALRQSEVDLKAVRK